MTRQEKIKKLEEAFLNKGYGEELQHYEIEEIIGEKKDSPFYSGIVSQAKKRLIEDGHMIENIKGIGYKVVHPCEYVDKSCKSISSGTKRIEKGYKILKSAPVKDMNVAETQALNTVRDRVSILCASMAGAQVEIKRLSRERENPLSLMNR